MADLSHGQPTEINDFRTQLNGLLATLQKLPVGEKQTAINLLKVTVKHQLENSVPVKDKQSAERFFYQDGGSHCSIPEEGSQESENEFEHHPSAVSEGQEIDEDLCLNHEVPVSQVHPQDSHLKHAIGENISFNILHLSDTDCLENTLTEAEEKDVEHLSHKGCKLKTEIKRENVNSELKINLDTSHDLHSNCSLKGDSIVHRKEDGILIQMASESQKGLLEDRALYNLDNGLKGNENDENEHHTCLESLGKYSEVLRVSEQDRLLEHAHEHAAIPVLTHSEQQLSLITSRGFCEGSQEVSDLGTILDTQTHDQDLSVLEEQSGHTSEDYGSGESLLQLKLLGGKQDQSEGKHGSCDKGNELNENSCGSLNLSHFHHISDRDNVYSEENSYLLPYLEKIGYKIESTTKRNDPECLEKSLEAAYSTDGLEYNERQREMLGEVEHDKTPVDLSSTSSSVQNTKDSSIVILEEQPSDSQQPQETVSKSDASYVWNRDTAKPSKAQPVQKQKRTRSENKRHKQAKLDKTLSLSEERFLKDTDHCKLHGKSATENPNMNKVSFEDITLKETMGNVQDDNHCHNYEANMSDNVDSMHLDNGKGYSECKNEHSETNMQATLHCQKTKNPESKGDEPSSNLLPVSCRNCKKELSDILLFLAHQQQCEGHLSCPICSAKFVHKVTYSRHMEGHKRNVCSKCSQSFCSHKKLKAHMKAEHNFDLVSKSYPCHMCSRSFLKRSSLYYHLKVHAVDNEEVCQKCGAFCRGKETFNLHMADHHKATKFHCHICSASFKRRQQYDDHLKHHKKNKCEFCGQPFTTKRALIRHCRHEHNTMPQNITLDREYKCDKCDRVFNRPSLLRHHLQLHRGVKLECRLCNKQFSHKRGLRKHMNSIVHEHTLLTNNLQKDHAYDAKQNYAYTCEYCGLKLPTRHLLSTHSRLTHKVGITWHCPHCDYTTKRNHTLKRHMQLHLESRNFMCEICGSSFQALATLKDHYNFVHSDERNYKCNECNKSFKNKSSLARHSRTHSDDRPYKCHCGTTYKRLSHLKRHSSSAHKETMKSRAVKKLKRSERSEYTEIITGDLVNVHEIDISKEFTENEDFEFVPASNCSLSPVIQTDVSVKSDILLPAQESIILMGENSNSEQGHLITVGDSQIIQLIPSTFQFPQDSSFQTVSLVSAGDLQGIPLSTSSSFSQGDQSSQVVVEPFSLSQSSEAMVMVPAGHHLGDTNPIPTTLHSLEDEALAESARIVRETASHGMKQEMALSTLEGHAELPVSPGLDTYSYSGAAASPQTSSLLPALPPPRFITHAHSHTASQDMLPSSLICADFVLPVEGNR